MEKGTKKNGAGGGGGCDNCTRCASLEHKSEEPGTRQESGPVELVSVSLPCS